MISRQLVAAVLAAGYALTAQGAELHVAKTGSDANNGALARPYLTIMAAANVAQPGDTITVHAGTYRERINPPRGGESEAQRITYQAAPGEQVEIKGSEVVKGWVKERDDVWKVVLPNTSFGSFNPYADLIRGDWFNGNGRSHHTGAVYLDGEWFMEAAGFDQLFGARNTATGYLFNVASISPGGERASERIQADRFSEKHGMQTAPCSEGNQCLGFINDGDWVRYDVDFGTRTETVSFHVASATTGGTMELRLDSPQGELVGTCPVLVTGDWQRWTTVTAKIKPTEGRRSLCLVCHGPDSANRLWFATVADGQTTIWARFSGLDPNTHQTEINARQSVFYPDKTGINYLTVRGFTLRDAATPWAPPTAEQVGLIGTNWSRGWVIEDNVISHSVCSGVTLGKYGDPYDNTSADSAEGYVKTVERATANGWSKENIGHHIVRRNTISHCEQAGICGSLGGIFSEITDNDISDIHVRQLFGGAEMAGIKLHAAIDVLIRGNRVHRTFRAIWMDWMAQGTRVTGNLCYDSADQDLFVEVDHGPYLVDNNLFLSARNLWDWSEGGAYVHNLFAGNITWHPDRSRDTPYLKAHSTTVAGLVRINDTDNRFYNNLFVQPASAPGGINGLSAYDPAKTPLQVGGNAFCGNATPYLDGKGAIARTNADPQLAIRQDKGNERLSMQVEGAAAAVKCPPVNTTLLGTTMVSKAAFENPDGSPLTVNTDYFGKPRVGNTVSVGPFANLPSGPMDQVIWPRH